MDATRDGRMMRRLLIAFAAAVLAADSLALAATAAEAPLKKRKPQQSVAVALKPSAELNLDPAPVEAPAITVEQVQSTLTELQATDDAELPEKPQLIELYEQTLADLKLAAENRARAAEFAKRRAAVPEKIELLKRAADAPPPPPATPPADAPLADLEQVVQAADEQLKVARAASEALEAEPQRRTTRRLEIPQAIAEAKATLAELDPGDNGVPDENALAKAHSLAAVAKRQSLTAQIDALEKELQSYDAAAAELLELDRDAALRTVAAAEQQAAKVRELLNRRRHAEADVAARDAHWQAAIAEPALRRLADENTALADHRRELAEKITRLGGSRETITKRLDKLREQHARMKEKVAAAGLTEAIGHMLRKHRGELVSLTALHKAELHGHEQIGDVQLRLFDYEEQLGALRDLDGQVRLVAAQLPAGSEANPEDIRALLKTRRESLTALIKDYNAYFADLVELDSTSHALLAQMKLYRSFIDQRVLWTRSTNRLGPGDAIRAADAVLWFVRPQHWWQLGMSVAANFQASTETDICVVAVIGLWFILVRRLKRITSHTEEVSLQDASPRSVRSTVAAAFVSLFVAARWPVAFWLVGWRLSHATAEFPASIGHGLQAMAIALAPLVLIRQICRPGGLAEAHFGWPSDALASIRRDVRWLIVAGAPLVAAISALEAQSNDLFKDSLGRFLFITTQVLLAAAMFQLMRPGGGGLRQLMNRRPESWASHGAQPLYLAFISVPLVLAALAVAGYYYTSLRLAWRLQTTVWLVLGVVVVQAILARWLTAMYRRLAVEAALQSKNAWSVDETSDDESPSASDPVANFVKVDAQTQRLLHSTAVLALVIGLAAVWVEVLPAVRIFQDVTLWSDAAGTSTSLANLIEAAIIVSMTIVAANNLPGLLDAIVLQRLPVDMGLRYALSSVLRYTIFIVGLAISGGTIGIGWPKIQWLAAAITFGLGFGLQEIFANFVSGLIVLIERPVRVGDVVTVGETTGKVSRIRIRATTIVDGDRKELIVPNKEFITSRLVNWTLTDTMTRVAVKIGIAYGSDLAQAQRLMQQVAAQTPQVLADPPPKALFLGFGDSSLNFELSVFVAQVEHQALVRHHVNSAIDQAFRKAGIEIPFPQRDIHVRSAASTGIEASIAEQAGRGERHQAA